MEPIQAQLLRAWQIHEDNNRALIDGVKQAGLESSLSTRGGRTVGQQLMHVVAVRRSVLEKMRRDLLFDVPELAREQGHDRELLRNAFEASGGRSGAWSRRALPTGGSRCSRAGWRRSSPTWSRTSRTIAVGSC